MIRKLARLRFVFAAALAAFAAVPSCATTTFTLSPSSQTVGLDGTFNLDVGLTSDASNIFGFDFEILYPAFVSPLSVNEQGFFLINGLVFSPDLSTPGVIALLLDASATADDQVSPGPDTLLSIQFHATGIGTGSFTLECDQGNDCADFPMLADDSLNVIPVDSIGSADVTVVAPEPSTLAPLSLFLSAGLLALRVRRRTF